MGSRGGGAAARVAPLLLAALGCGPIDRVLDGPEALRVALAGCDDVRRGPRCLMKATPAGARPLRLFVQTSPGARVRVLSGRAPLPVACGDAEPAAACEASGGEALLVLQVPAQAAALTVTADLPGQLRKRELVLRIEPLPGAPDFLAQAAALRGQDLPQQAALVLRAQDGAAQAPEVQALAAGELGRALVEQHLLQEAEQPLRTAVRLDEAAGLLWHQGADLFRLADVLLDQRRSKDMEKVLGEHEPLFGQLLDMRAWRSYYRARGLRARGQLDKALRELDEAEAWARRSGDRRPTSLIVAARAGIYVDLGRALEADRIVGRAAADLGDLPCRRGTLLGQQSALRVRVLEGLLGEGEGQARAPDTEERLGAQWAEWEPLAPAPPAALLRERHDERVRAILNGALEALKGGRCLQARHVAKLHLTGARLALLMGRIRDGALALDQVRAALAPAHVDPAIDDTFALDWTELSARLHRAGGRYDEALRLSGHLLALAGAGEDPGPREDPYEARWAAQLGIALSQLGMGRREAAVTALWQAQRELELRSLGAPQFLGRGSFLGRFEGGARLLLAQLLRAGEGQVRATEAEQAEAFELVRHLRTRPLLELRRLLLLERLDEAGRGRLEAAVSGHRAVMRQLEQVLPEGGPRVAELQRRAALLLGDGLKLLGESAAPGGSKDRPPHRPPAEGEVLLGCHPLPQGWACLASFRDRGRVRVQTALLPQLDPRAPRRELARALLQPFQAALRQARVLSVLAFGALRDVPVHQLALEDRGRPLGEALLVRYPLDLRADELSADPAPPGPRAVIVVDSQLERAAGVEITRPLAALLQPPWQPRFYDMDHHAQVRGAAPAPPLGPELRRQLPGAGHLHVTAHGDSAPASGWLQGIRLSPWSRFTAGDVLLLERVPQRVVLIVCRGGSSRDTLGGQEALGLAQAFLLRGSREVLATTRDVSLEAGAAVSRLLYAQLPAPEASLGEAFRATSLRLSAPGDEADRALSAQVGTELDHFRVLVQ